VATVIGIAALLFLDGSFSEYKIFIITAVLCVFCSIIYFVAPPILPEETETHGWLLPANEPTPPNGCDSMAPPKEAILFLFGSNGVWSTSNEKIHVFTLGSCPVLSMQHKAHRLLIDADLFDNSGNLVVRITKNEFNLVSGQYSYGERSEDRSTIAVHDRQGNEVFYIRYVNPAVARVRGEFSCRDGTTAIITDDRVFDPKRRNLISGSCQGNSRPEGFWIGADGMLHL
jgi:hypothetical protein